MQKRIDILKTAQSLLEELGNSPVFLSLPDACKHREYTVVTSGVPMTVKRYFDGTGTESVRLTILFRRVSEGEAIEAATSASTAFGRPGAMQSRNGSYQLETNSAEKPTLLTWADGTFVYGFDATITYKEE